MVKAQQTGGGSGKRNSKQEIFAGLSMERYSSGVCKKSGVKCLKLLKKLYNYRKDTKDFILLFLVSWCLGGEKKKVFFFRTQSNQYSNNAHPCQAG